MSSPAALKTSSALMVHAPRVKRARVCVASTGSQAMAGSMSCAGARMQRSLNSVTVSARFISGPFASTIWNAESRRTRNVAGSPMKRWNTSTGSPFIVAFMKNRRLGSAPKKLCCSATKSIHGSVGPPRMRPCHVALRRETFGWPTAPERRT